MCVHIMNCIWITLGKFNDGKVSWIRTVIPEEALVEDYLKSVYINGFYYNITTIATVGFGDISCQTLFEMLYACFCMFFGIALFAYIQGGLVDAIKTSLLSGEIKEAKHQEDFQSWLIEREQNIAHPISSKKLKLMRECIQFKFKYEFTSFIFESEYYQYLPPLDQQRIFIFYFTEFTTLYSTFFRNISDVNVAKQIITAFKPVYIPKDTIVQAYSTKPKGIYFIFKGKILIEKMIELKDKLELLPFRELQQGSFIGEICLIDKSSKFNYRVSEDKDLYCFFLKKDRLYKILEDYPLILQQLMKFSHFRHKYFKFEGDKIEEQNNIYNTTIKRKSTLNVSKRINKLNNQITLQALSKAKTINHEKFRQINKEQQEELERQQTQEKNSKETKLVKRNQSKLYLLEQLQILTEEQNTAIFKEIQSQNTIVNLYKQIVTLSQRLTQSKTNSGHRQAIIPLAEEQQFTRDIFQEQFDEKDSKEEISTKQPFQQEAKANDLSKVGQENINQYEISKDSNLNVGDTYQINQIRQQSFKLCNVRSTSSLTAKDSPFTNQNSINDTQNLPLIQNIKSLSNSSFQGTQPQKSRLSLVRESEEQKRYNAKSDLNRSNSLFRRNGLLQSHLRENNQQIVHKRSQSDSYTPFQFSPVHAPAKFSDDQITVFSNKNNSNLQYLGNGQLPFSSIQSPQNNSNLQVAFPLNSDDDNDNINDVKSFQVKSNKKDDYQTYTTNTQITNPLITLNTEADQQLLQEENKGIEDKNNNYTNQELIALRSNSNNSGNINYYDSNIVNQLINSDEVVDPADDLQNASRPINYFQKHSIYKDKRFLQDLNEDEIIQDSYIENDIEQNKQMNNLFQINIEKKDFKSNNDINSNDQLEQQRNNQNKVYFNNTYPYQITEESVQKAQTYLMTQQSNQQNIDEENILNTIPSEQQFLYEMQTIKKEPNDQLFQTIQDTQLTERDELVNPFPNTIHDQEQFHNKSIHIPTEPNDYANNNTESSVQNGKSKKTHADRFIKKNYYEDQKRKSLNIKKIYQQQLQSILNEAEMESQSRYSNPQGQYQGSQDQNSRIASARNSALNFHIPLHTIASNANNNSEYRNLNSGNNSSPSHQNSPQNNQNQDSSEIGKDKRAQTPQNKINQSKKIDQEMLSPSSQDNHYNRTKTLSQYLQKSKNSKQKGYLSHFQALLKIMTLDKTFKKKNEEQITDYINKKQNNLESSQASIRQLKQTEVNLDQLDKQDELPSIASFVELQKEEEEPEFTENLLDKSIDVPIEIIEPSFTLEDFNYAVPYLKNQIHRLENRVEEILESVRGCNQFCNEKIQKIQQLKYKKQMEVQKTQKQENTPQLQKQEQKFAKFSLL